MDPEVPCSNQGGGTTTLFSDVRNSGQSQGVVKCSAGLPDRTAPHMTIALISDIHGNRSALEAVLDDIERRGIKEVVNLGDSLSGPLDAAGTADLLIPLNLPTVQGNHDRALHDRPRSDMGLWEDWIVDELSETHIDWLKSLPSSIMQDDAFLCHATPNDDEIMWLHAEGPTQRMINRDLSEIIPHLPTTQASLIACGHTHTQTLIRIPAGPTIVNPGSVGCPAFADTRVDPPFLHQTGAPDARYAIADKADGTWRVDFIAVPYDPTEMMKIAKDRGADSWVQALATGWFA